MGFGLWKHEMKYHTEIRSIIQPMAPNEPNSFVVQQLNI
jgi:hypothetical protein